MDVTVRYLPKIVVISLIRKYVKKKHMFLKSDCINAYPSAKVSTSVTNAASMTHCTAMTQSTTLTAGDDAADATTARLMLFARLLMQTRRSVIIEVDCILNGQMQITIGQAVLIAHIHCWRNQSRHLWATVTETGCVLFLVLNAIRVTCDILCSGGSKQVGNFLLTTERLCAFLVTAKGLRHFLVGAK